MTLFRYAPALIGRFPAVVGGVIWARGLANGPTPPALADAFRAEQRAALDRLGNRSLAELPSLAAWRRTFREFGVDPTQYRSAAEALLRRLTKQGEIPSVNLLVDLGNLVSIRYALPVAVFDRRATTGAVTVRFAEGRERFTDLGTDVVQNPSPGEVIFVDEAGLVSARRWCWRQSAQSAAQSDTTEALITVEGHHESALADVGAALEDLLTLLQAYVPGARLESALLSAAAPDFAPDASPRA